MKIIIWIQIRLLCLLGLRLLFDAEGGHCSPDDRRESRKDVDGRLSRRRTGSLADAIGGGGGGGGVMMMTLLADGELQVGSVVSSKHFPASTLEYTDCICNMI